MPIDSTAMPQALEFDIVMVSDFRFPGGTSASLAEEVRAQAAAGYSTGLVHVPGPLVSSVRGFNKRIRHCIETGAATLVPPDTAEVTARLAVFRHPAVFQSPPEGPRVRTDRAVLVANQAARGASGGQRYYDVAAVASVVGEMAGCEPEWAPIGPLVRETLEDSGMPLRDGDWHNVLDVDAWAVDRTRFVADRPVIGRHSRPQWQKWPSSRQDLLAAYPDDGEFAVRILGGAGPAQDVLGEVPPDWKVLPFDALSVPEFLRDVDFFVYFHHPEWVEAFGRTILEALASGAVAIVPEHFRVLFGDACVYGKPQDVRRVARQLYTDKPAYDAQSAKGQAFVRERFGHETHRQRVAAYVPAPSGTPQALTTVRVPKPRILFVSSNGAGMGHLTRLLAMARRASDRFQPLFLSLSQAAPVVETEGFPYEYYPSRAYMGITPRDWNRLFGRRLTEMLDWHRPRAVVFDGTWPYEGFSSAREAHPEVAFVWSRRAMWKPGANAEQLDKAVWFDLVVEPGEFAAAADRGVTTSVTDVLRVPPVTLLDEDELLSRDEAMEQLGLDSSRPAVLVTLGAGNINDITTDLDVFVSTLTRDENRQVCVTQPVIAAREVAQHEAVRPVSRYPLSRYVRAFDFAVAAAGYNAFHELVGFAVPTIFAPNTETALDDQHARARYAEEVGVALCLAEVTEASTAQAVKHLDDPERRQEISKACREHFLGNGARMAMEAVEDLATPVRSPAGQGGG